LESSMQTSLFPELPAYANISHSMATSAAQDPSKWQYAISLDTETSGSCSASRVIQLAALRFRFRLLPGTKVPDVEFSERFRLVSLVRPPPGTPFNPYATRVHGITADRLRREPEYKDVHARFLEVVGELELVAHNVVFDRRMMEREHEHSGLPLLSGSRWVCSLQMAKKRYPGQTCKLGDVTRRLGIAPSGALHDAGVDAELAARLYAHMVVTAAAGA
jgi:DNA polymerase-3 subunit epsilon